MLVKKVITDCEHHGLFHLQSHYMCFFNGTFFEDNNLTISKLEFKSGTWICSLQDILYISNKVTVKKSSIQNYTGKHTTTRQQDTLGAYIWASMY